MFPLRNLRLALVFSLLFAGLASAQDIVDKPKFVAPALTAPTEKLPAVFRKKTPESVAELKAFQDHVAKLVERVTPAVVSVRVGQAFGSGVIVSKDGFILTAGHVSGAPDRDVTIYFHDGKTAKGKTLGGNHGIDSGLIKITSDQTDWPTVEMGDSSALKTGDWCLVIAHPGGYKKGRTPPVRLGRVLNNEEKRATITTDAVLVGGDSGGPLFDMHGRVVGVNSRIGNSLAANMHVSVNPFREEWNQIAQGEILGVKMTPFLGIEMDAKDDHVLITAIMPKSPAEKAGLKANDLILKYDARNVDGPNDLATFVRGSKPGDQVTIEVRRGEEILKLKVQIGKR